MPRNQGGAVLPPIVRIGEYGRLDAGGTYSLSEQRLLIAPGTVITSALTISGNDVALHIGSGADLQAALTLSGTNSHVVCENGVDMIQLTISGDNGFFDGGGHDTLIDATTTGQAITVGGDDVTVQNIKAQNTSSAGTNTCVYVSGDRVILLNIRVVQADHDGIILGGDDGQAIGCKVDDADRQDYSISGPRSSLIGCSGGGGSEFVEIYAAGDDSIISGCVAVNAASTITIHADAENCVVVGNRCKAITDNSGTSTVASNDTT